MKIFLDLFVDKEKAKMKSLSTVDIKQATTKLLRKLLQRYRLLLKEEV